MSLRIIRSEEDYKKALQEIEVLMDSDPSVGTSESDRLEILSLLLEEYEDRNYPIAPPDPIEAILFRMEQQRLRQRDLVPFIGSRSKVSEILSRSRPLSLSMIRALHTGLGIPADVLLQESEPSFIDPDDIEWDKFPLEEMHQRGWLIATPEEIEQAPKRVMRTFLNPIGAIPAGVALQRRTEHIRSARSMDRYALMAWAARIQIIALKDAPDLPPVRDVNFEMMRELVKLSTAEQGPLLAREFLKANGISLVIQPHLPGTYLDGAAMLNRGDQPIIGMTIRHDRIDNFWFTLMHELAHVALHIQDDIELYYDDLDLSEVDDPREIAADKFAGEVLIPEDKWSRSPASMLKSADAAIHLAEGLQIHPAIVAGRMRFKFGSYKMLSQLVGYHEVRRLFTEIEW